MSRDRKIKGETSSPFSPVRTRRHSGKQIETEKVKNINFKNSVKKAIWCTKR
jgi:hypothetical protein